MIDQAQLGESSRASTVQHSPVTVVVRHRIRPNKIAEFETWLRGITQAMAKYPGHLGFNVLRPVDLQRLEYVVFFRFDDFTHLEAWENSSERNFWLAEVVPLSLDSPVRERHTGMEVWFTLPPGHRPPARWKMGLVTLLAIYPLVLLSQMFLTPLIFSWPIALRTLATSAVLVCVMTYFQMPVVTKIFSRWLYGPGA